MLDSGSHINGQGVTCNRVRHSRRGVGLARRFNFTCGLTVLARGGCGKGHDTSDCQVHAWVGLAGSLWYA